MIYGTSDTVRRWSSDAVRRWSLAVTILLGYSPALELGYIPALELGSGTALVLVRKRYHKYSPALELGRKRMLPPGNNLKTKVWHKNNKALIKAVNLKGLLGYPTCKLFGFTSAILKIEDGKIC